MLLVLQGLLGSLDIFLVKVGAVGTATENDKAVLVALCAGNGGEALLGDTHEVVLGGGSTNGVNGNAEIAIGAILEADREGQTRGQLTMKLRLGGAGTNGADGNAVGKELGGDGVEHLTGDGHAVIGQIDKELARDAESLVDLEGVVNVGIVDQTLPTDSGSGLLEVGTHDDAEVAGELLGESLETSGIFVRHERVVDGAGTNYNEQAVAAAQDNVGSVIAALQNSLGGIIGQGNLGGEERRRDEGILSKDFPYC